MDHNTPSVGVDSTYTEHARGGTASYTNRQSLVREDTTVMSHTETIQQVTDVDSSVPDVGIESQQDIAALDSALHDHTTVLDATGQSQLVPAASDTAQ
ncbi:hypothetical protein Q3G72_007052 [Acer saccharum]|nr:hypothetical protein Q3G72_007052 [Acer saccharum]